MKHTASSRPRMPSRTGVLPRRFQEGFSFPGYLLHMSRRAWTASPLAGAAAACTALAAASLVYASGPTYDSFTWLIWGRQIAHGQLNTAIAGSGWKPLPPLVDALLSPLGSGAASVWLVVARAGALFALVMAFRLAWRIAPHRFRLAAGLLAAITLLITKDWVNRTGIGDAEGLMTAFGLLAIERHLDGHRSHAFWLLILAGLIRVEVWPFAAAYGLWLVAKGEMRRQVVAGALVILGLWFGGDYLGSGSFGTAAGMARHPVAGTAGAAPHPFLAVLREAYHMLPVSAWIAAIAAVAIVARRRRAGDALLTLALAAGGVVWTLIVATMAARGYAGLSRFLFMACALFAVVGGAGVALLVDAFVRSPARQRFAPAATAALLISFAAGAATGASAVPGRVAALKRVDRMDAGLRRAIARAGGAAGVLRCGPPATPWFAVTALEWELHAGPGGVQDSAEGPRPISFTPHHGGVWRVHTHRCPTLEARSRKLRSA